MTQILFVQGGGEGAHDAWDNKLVANLQAGLGADYEVLYPKMPGEGDPKYETWRAALRSAFAKLPDGSLLVGHSIGATILLNTLADAAPPFRCDGVYLVAAPFVGADGWPPSEFGDMGDIGQRLPQQLRFHFYHGDADDTADVAHLALYAQAIPGAKTTRLPRRDHQLNNDLAEVALDILAHRTA